MRQFGRIDVLINNAGTNHAAPLLDFSDADWKRVVDLQLEAVHYLSHLVAPIMVRQGGGKIINVASALSFAADLNATAYTVAKHGIVGMTRSYAAELGRSYEDVNVVVAHVGGGLSVAAHEHGRMIDTNDVLEGSGPFAPNRSGDVPLKPVIGMAAAGATAKELMQVVGKTGGLMGLTGTDDTLALEERIADGDTWAKLALDAMAYQTSKALAGLAAALCGKVDGIILTGGVSNDPYFVQYVTDHVGWIAPVRAYGGDFEMEALAAGAVRALSGAEQVMTYTGEPSWTGFTMDGAIADVEA